MNISEEKNKNPYYSIEPLIGPGEAVSKKRERKSRGTVPLKFLWLVNAQDLYLMHSILPENICFLGEMETEFSFLFH